MDTSAVTRVEVLDYDREWPRAYSRWGLDVVELSLQDDGKTLKIFINAKAQS